MDSEMKRQFLALVKAVGKGNGEGVHYELSNDQGEIVHQAPLGWPDDASDNHFAWRIPLPERFHGAWPFNRLKVVVEESDQSFSMHLPPSNGSEIVVIVGDVDVKETFERLTNSTPAFSSYMYEEAR